MRMSKGWLLLALPLAVAACGGGEEGGEQAQVAPDTAVVATGTGPDTATGAGAVPTDTGGAMTGGAGNVALVPVGNSGVAGTATVGGQGQQTQVAVSLTGLQPETPHSGHVHQGSCESLGPPVAPLQDVRADSTGAGTSTSTLSVAMETVMNGQHVIAYHQAAGANAGAPVTCGAIQGHGAGH
jgi:hypothetical protein